MTRQFTAAQVTAHNKRIKGEIAGVVADLKAPVKQPRTPLTAEIERLQKDYAAAKPKKRETKWVPTEWDEQCAVVAWWRASAASYGLDSRLLVASVNGAILGGDARLRSIQAARLKKSGLVEGEPDLCLRVARPERPRKPIPEPGTLQDYGIFLGLYLEMKRVGWKPSKSGKALKHWQRQLEMHDLLRDQGYRVLICAGAELAVGAIREYLR